MESQLLRGGGCPIGEGREGVTARGARIVVSDNSQRPPISTVSFAIPNGSSGSFRASNRGRLSVKRPAAPFATECQLCHAQHLQAAPDPSGGMADQPELF